MLEQVGNGTECVSFDLRPSDAINIAVRCKVLFFFHITLLVLELTIILKVIYNCVKVVIETLQWIYR